MDSIVDDPGLAPYRLVARPDALAREGLFAVEGRLVLPQLLASRYRIHSVLLSEGARESLQPTLAAHPGLNILVAPPDTMAAVTGYDFHRGCIALAYREEPTAIPSVLEPGVWGLEPVVILENVSNPDNLGGIFRSAQAFGAAAIVLGPGCADPLYRKAIRTSMGAALHVPWFVAAGWPGDLARIRDSGRRLVALTTDPRAAHLRDALAGPAPVALLLGSEGYGLSPQALAAADARARIPMAANVDSLNVATAASIALYEWGLTPLLRKNG